MIRTFVNNEPQIHPSAYVDQSAQIIGNVTLGEDSSIWPGAIVRGDIHKITIGKRTNIQDLSVVHVTHDSHFSPGGFATHLGDDITVGHRVILHGCTIEDKCLIGMGAIIMDGAVIESGAVLGAGSLVSPGKRLEGGYLWLGQPAKKIRPLNEEEREFLAYSAQHYMRLKNQY